MLLTYLDSRYQKNQTHTGELNQLGTLTSKGFQIQNDTSYPNPRGFITSDFKHLKT